MRYLGLQLIVGAGDSAQGLTAPASNQAALLGRRACRVGARSLGTGRIIRRAGASRTSRRAAGASCASWTRVRSDRDLDRASRCGNAGFGRDLVARLGAMAAMNAIPC